MVDVRMNYGSMEKMEKEFRDAASQLEDTRSEMEKVSNMLEDGLRGAGGDAYREAINSQLIPALKELTEKMNELAQDIKGAVEATRDGVSTAKSRFK
jgi:WXG100 family type VII secretion target